MAGEEEGQGHRSLKRKCLHQVRVFLSSDRSTFRTDCVRRESGSWIATTSTSAYAIALALHPLSQGQASRDHHGIRAVIRHGARPKNLVGDDKSAVYDLDITIVASATIAWKGQFDRRSLPKWNLAAARDRCAKRPAERDLANEEAVSPLRIGGEPHDAPRGSARFRFPSCRDSDEPGLQFRGRKALFQIRAPSQVRWSRHEASHDLLRGESRIASHELSDPAQGHRNYNWGR